MTVDILVGDCREVLASLPEKHFHTCVTSPPYFGLRDYGVDGQIGLEQTPDAFVAELVAVFREVRRVLRDDGTVWLNLGDSYAGGGGHSPDAPSSAYSKSGLYGMALKSGGIKPQGAIKPKDLIGIPWRVAFALQADGWYLRQDIIWAKPNPMPESVKDRCTKAHEYIFMLSKRARYWFDADAIAESANSVVTMPGMLDKRGGTDRNDAHNGTGGHSKFDPNAIRNRRSVWTVATQPFSGAHFATFPPALIEPCILAGAPAECCAACGEPYERQVERTTMVIARSKRTHEKGQTRASGTMLEPARSKTLGFAPACDCGADAAPGRVLDPFGGAGTTGMVADRLQRNATLVELNPEYAQMAAARLNGDAGMFSQVRLRTGTERENVVGDVVASQRRMAREARKR